MFLLQKLSVEPLKDLLDQISSDEKTLEDSTQKMHQLGQQISEIRWTVDRVEPIFIEFTEKEKSVRDYIDSSLASLPTLMSVDASGIRQSLTSHNLQVRPQIPDHTCRDKQHISQVK